MVCRRTWHALRVPLTQGLTTAVNCTHTACIAELGSQNVQSQKRPKRKSHKYNSRGRKRSIVREAKKSTVFRERKSQQGGG